LCCGLGRTGVVGAILASVCEVDHRRVALAACRAELDLDRLVGLADLRHCPSTRRAHEPSPLNSLTLEAMEPIVPRGCKRQPRAAEGARTCGQVRARCCWG